MFYCSHCKVQLVLQSVYSPEHRKEDKTLLYLIQCKEIPLFKYGLSMSEEEKTPVISQSFTCRLEQQDVLRSCGHHLNT